jgi:acyl-CoA thioester hydrolase
MNREGLGCVSFETAFSHAVEPRASDFDELGHVNNAVYLRWAQEIAIRHWGLIAGEALIRKYLWVVLRHEVDYRDPVLPGDEVLARTWLGQADGPRFDRFIDIRKPDASRASASVRTVWCMLDAQTRKPRRVGAEIFEAFGITS